MALTKNDFRQIQNLIEITVEEIFEEKLVPFRNEIMTKLDAILFEMTNHRMEQDVTSHRV